MIESTLNKNIISGKYSDSFTLQEIWYWKHFGCPENVLHAISSSTEDNCNSFTLVFTLNRNPATFCESEHDSFLWKWKETFMNYCHIKKQTIIFLHLILILKIISRQFSHQSFSWSDYLKHRTEFKSVFKYESRKEWKQKKYLKSRLIEVKGSIFKWN